MASTYSKADWHQQLERTVSNAILAHLPWLGLAQDGGSSPASSESGKRLLDYACGPGMVTRTLAPYINAAVGVDVSERMVERYRELADTLKLQKLDGIVGNLVDAQEKEEGAAGAASATSPSMHDFDLAVVGLGFHHFDDPARAAKALASRLRSKTGVLLIIDFVGGCGSKADREKAEKLKRLDEQQGEKNKDDNQGSLIPEAMHDTVRVHGFDRAAMERIYTTAGLWSFEWDELEEEVELVVDGESKRRRVFLAKGLKE